VGLTPFVSVANESGELDGNRAQITKRAHLDGDGAVAKGAARDQVRKEMPMLPLLLSSAGSMRGK
jgi:hypothetical protein